MFVELALVLLNAGLLFVGRMLRMPGVDILPSAGILIASQGGSWLLWTGLLLLAFFILSPHAFSMGWVTLPVLFVSSLLAYLGVPVLVCLLVYYVLSLGFGFFLGQIGPRYGMFLGTNTLINFGIIVLFRQFG